MKRPQVLEDLLQKSPKAVSAMTEARWKELKENPNWTNYQWYEVVTELNRARKSETMLVEALKSLEVGSPEPLTCAECGASSQAGEVLHSANCIVREALEHACGDKNEQV